MGSTAPPGTFVYVDTNPAYELKSGDIITFEMYSSVEQRKQVVTHRFVGYNPDGSLQTQGDANLTLDSPDDHHRVWPGDVRGHVVNKFIWPHWNGYYMTKGSLVALVMAALAFWLIWPPPDHLMAEPPYDPRHAPGRHRRRTAPSK